MSELNQIEKQFLELVKKMTSYNEAIELMYWDLRTGASKKGVEQRSEVIGMLSSEVFAMSTSTEMERYLNELTSPQAQGQINKITKRVVEECQKEFARNNKIPADEYREFVILQSKAESVWVDAKEKSDFDMFCPFLENLVDHTNKFIDYWGYE